MGVHPAVLRRVTARAHVVEGERREATLERVAVEQLHRAAEVALRAEVPLEEAGLLRGIEEEVAPAAEPDAWAKVAEEPTTPPPTITTSYIAGGQAGPSRRSRRWATRDMA